MALLEEKYPLMHLAAHDFEQGLPLCCDRGLGTFTSAMVISSSTDSIVSSADARMTLLLAPCFTIPKSQIRIRDGCLHHSC